MIDMAHERDSSSEEEVMAGELRRGPWTVEEDVLLMNYVDRHGEGRWNSLARSAGGITIQATETHVNFSLHHLVSSLIALWCVPA